MSRSLTGKPSLLVVPWTPATLSKQPCGAVPATRSPLLSNVALSLIGMAEVYLLVRVMSRAVTRRDMCLLSVLTKCVMVRVRTVLPFL